MTGKPAAPAFVATRCAPARIHLRHIEQITERLSARDKDIIDDIHRLRLVTGAQLERLHFTDLSPASRGRTRRRVLHRLVSWRVLATLPRRVGGVRAGSNGLIYHLDTTGAWLMRLQALAHGHNAPRRPTTPSAGLTAHILAVSELYVQLAEHARTSGFQVATFQAEPACWWPDDLGGHLKPDAYALLAAHGYQDAWWIEADRGTEHRPALQRKLMSYLDFAHRGGIGPTSVLPRVLFTTPTQQRGATLTALITALPPPAKQLFHVAPHDAAADLLVTTLTQP